MPMHDSSSRNSTPSSCPWRSRHLRLDLDAAGVAFGQVVAEHHRQVAEDHSGGPLVVYETRYERPLLPLADGRGGKHARLAEMGLPTHRYATRLRKLPWLSMPSVPRFTGCFDMSDPLPTRYGTHSSGPRLVMALIEASGCFRLITGSQRGARALLRQARHSPLGSWK